MQKTISVFILLILFLTSPLPAFAHAFGQVYTLPLPTWLYLYGGGAALLLSFLIIGFFARDYKRISTFSKKDISSWIIIKFFQAGITQIVLKTVSIFLFFLCIIAGLFGSSEPLLNFSSVFIWIIFYLGFTYTIAIFGNFWELVNPWKILLHLGNKIYGDITKPLTTYPKKIGYAPAAFFYFIFIFIELSGIGADPKFLAILIVIYSNITFVCVFLFGEKEWFTYGEFFSVFFGMLSKISIIQPKEKKLYLQLPFVNLMEEKPTHLSLLYFIIFMLSSTAFDGFRSTTAWWQLYRVFVPSENFLGENAARIIQGFLLFLSPILFMALYFLVISLMKIFVKTKYSIPTLSLQFAFSLIPIALVYHIAHYYTLLLVEGQAIIPLLSDPLLIGWNLFNTAAYTVNAGIVSASFVWNSQVVCIVLGHIIAVYVAHIIALKLFPSKKQVVISQIPMLILMITYTILGLWILSQPYSLNG